jgi:hypothetical protein
MILHINSAYEVFSKSENENSDRILIVDRDLKLQIPSCPLPPKNYI